jgi:hypothetical protein
MNEYERAISIHDRKEKRRVSASMNLLLNHALTRRMFLVELVWRRRADSNRRWGFCRPLPYHLATSPDKKMERETGFEPATFSLARRRSTPEPLPQNESHQLRSNALM